MTDYIQVGERFDRNVAEHEMKVILDDGLHRHLLFKKPGTTDQHFRIVTWPGHLTFCGDMGTFTFYRNADMFDFFMGSGGGISPHYWQEKLQAGAGSEGSRAIAEEWDSDSFKQSVLECWKDWLQGDSLPDPEATEEVKEYLRDNMLNCCDELEAVTAVREYDCDEAPNLLDDFWETSDTRLRYHYLWCCYAIVWGIKQYRQREEQEAA